MNKMMKTWTFAVVPRIEKLSWLPPFIARVTIGSVFIAVSSDSLNTSISSS